MVSKLRLLSAFVVLLLLLCGSVVTQGAGRPRYGKRVVASLLEEPVAMDPIVARTYTDMEMVKMMFDTLYRVEGQRVVPRLASSLPDERNPLRVRISLRPGVRFHDGSLLKAQDVAASLERLLHSDLGYVLDGVIAVTAAPGNSSGKTADVVLSLRVPNRRLAWLLANLHSSITKGGEAPSWRRSVGTGPWLLEQRLVSRKMVVMRAFEAYFGGRAYLDTLELHWFDSGELEARRYERGVAHLSLRGSIAFVGHRPKFRTSVREQRVALLAYLGFGSASAISLEPDFRRAVSAAIGRIGMRAIGSGESVFPATTVLVPRRAARSFALRSNPRLVRRLLRSLSARYPEVKAKRLVLTLLVNASRPDDAAVAARVAAALFSYGLLIKIVSVPAKVFRARLGSNCDLYIGQLANASAMPFDRLRRAFVVGGQRKMLASFAGKGRSFMERKFAETLPLVPLFHRSVRVHFRSDLRGVDSDPDAGFSYSELFFVGTPTVN